MPIPFFNSPNGFFVKKLHPDPVSQDYLVLKAVGVTAEKITPGNANQVVEWDTAVGEAVPGEPLKWRVKRDSPTKHEVKIKVKQGGAVASQMNVWVVWWDVTAQKVSGPTTTYQGGWTNSETTWAFTASPIPAGKPGSGCNFLTEREQCCQKSNQNL